MVLCRTLTAVAMSTLVGCSGGHRLPPDALAERVATVLGDASDTCGGGNDAITDGPRCYRSKLRPPTMRSMRLRGPTRLMAA